MATVRGLNPGQAFRVALGGGHPPLEFRLIHVSQCRAYVEPLKKTRRRIVSDDGDLLAEFDGRGRGVNISPGTECELIHETEFEEELEDILGMGDDKKTNDKKTSDKKKTDEKKIDDAKKTRGKNGVRSKPPGTQTRAIKEGTIRRKLYVEMGRTKSVAKLCERLGMTKSVLLAHVNEFWRAHGHGYLVDGDRVELVPPSKVAIVDRAKPATAEKPAAAKKAAKKAAATRGKTAEKPAAVADPLADLDDDDANENLVDMDDIL